MARSGRLIRSTLVAVAAVLAGAACGGDSKQQGGTQATPGDASIQIVNFQFTPQHTSAKPGSRVTWTNGDTAVHSIKDTSPLATPVSPDMAKGATFSITYGQPGSYAYICGIHQYMTGSVTVAP
jgi:plastocyanin